MSIVDDDAQDGLCKSCGGGGVIAWGNCLTPSYRTCRACGGRGRAYMGVIEPLPVADVVDDQAGAGNVRAE